MIVLRSIVDWHYKLYCTHCTLGRISSRMRPCLNCSSTLQHQRYCMRSNLGEWRWVNLSAIGESPEQMAQHTILFHQCGIWERDRTRSTIQSSSDWHWIILNIQTDSASTWSLHRLWYRSATGPGLRKKSQLGKCLSLGNAFLALLVWRL